MFLTAQHIHPQVQAGFRAQYRCGPSESVPVRETGLRMYHHPRIPSPPVHAHARLGRTNAGHENIQYSRTYTAWQKSEVTRLPHPPISCGLAARASHTVETFIDLPIRTTSMNDEKQQLMESYKKEKDANVSKRLYRVA